MKKFDIAAFRAAHPPSYQPGDPADYPHTAVLRDLTPDHPGCARILAAVRETAAAATDNDYGLAVERNPETGERTGYRVGARSKLAIVRILLAADAARRPPRTA